MTDAQLEDINTRLAALTQRVNSLEILTGTIGTSQAAIAQIYSRLDNFAETTNSNFAQVTRRFDRQDERFNSIDNDLNQLKTDVAEILRILRDRNGGSGI
ncbi:MAG: hypothetical protein KME52_11905 [Desmonostoc geniculatum HA4340-LM1]|jgi:ABC-type transporter Mla subunit MlaD|nr:hypothetical protein [Desmonostoc geniculatum HA4340-LM1]